MHLCMLKTNFPLKKKYFVSYQEMYKFAPISDVARGANNPYAPPPGSASVWRMPREGCCKVVFAAYVTITTYINMLERKNGRESRGKPNFNIILTGSKLSSAYLYADVSSYCVLTNLLRFAFLTRSPMVAFSTQDK